MKKIGIFGSLALLCLLLMIVCWSIAALHGTYVDGAGVLREAFGFIALGHEFLTVGLCFAAIQITIMLIRKFYKTPPR